MNTNITTSLGAGSGIDVKALVRDLAAASREPKVSRINQLTQQNQARISAVSQARSDLDELANSLAELVGDGTLRSAPTASNENILQASLAPGADPAAIAASIEVLALARAQNMASGVHPSRSAPIGQGSFTLTVGGTATTITVGAGNDSLDGLASAINAAGTGVRASVVGDVGGVRLVLKGETGAAKAFSFTLDSGSDPALSAFAQGAGGGMSVTQPARDASLRVDGLLFERATNTISDILPGVTLTLKKAQAGELVDLGSSRPQAAIKQAVSDFVAAFNQMRTSIKDAVKLAGPNSELRALDNELLSIANSVLTSHASIRRLADVGVATSRDGTLQLDAAKFDQAMARDPAAVEALFNPLRDTNRTETTDPGLTTMLDRIRDRAVASNGALDRVGKSLDARKAALADSLAKVEAREAAYAARLERQYATLDSRVGALRATQAYLEQQIEVWNGNSR